ncbi:hypothetical protein J3B02_004011, partial [Coemansia erecta]
MSFLDADREARRRARYRGNPERARFHRDQSASNEFVIRVSDSHDPRDSQSRNSALVHKMRNINLNHSSSASPELSTMQMQPETIQDGSDNSSSSSSSSSSGKTNSKHLLPRPAIRLSSSLNAVALVQQKAADEEDVG